MFGPDSFFTEEVVSDSFFGPSVMRALREDLLTELAQGQLTGVPDTEAGAALSDCYATSLSTTELMGAMSSLTIRSEW